MKISTAAREYLIEIEVRKFTPKTIRQFTSYLSSRGKKAVVCDNQEA